MGEAWVDVGVLVERKCDMGPLLELNQMSAHVDCWGRRGCAGGRQAWHGPLLEMRQMGVPVGRRLGARGFFGGGKAWHEPLPKGNRLEGHGAGHRGDARLLNPSWRKGANGRRRALMDTVIFKVERRRGLNPRGEATRVRRTVAGNKAL